MISFKLPNLFTRQFSLPAHNRPIILARSYLSVASDTYKILCPPLTHSSSDKSFFFPRHSSNSDPGLILDNKKIIMMTTRRTPFTPSTTNNQTEAADGTTFLLNSGQLSHSRCSVLILLNGHILTTYILISPSPTNDPLTPPRSTTPSVFCLTKILIYSFQRDEGNVAAMTTKCLKPTTKEKVHDCGRATRDISGQ